MIPLWLKKLTGYQLPKGRWASMAEPYAGDEIVVLDCETSIFDKRKAELLSVAAVRIKGQEVCLSQALNLTIASDAKTDPVAVRVHHLRHEDRQGGVSLEEAIELLLEFIGNRPICGFYIAYDRAILNRYIKGFYRFTLPNKFLDVGDIYIDKTHPLLLGVEHQVTFEQLAKDLSVPIIERHTALGDVITTALMYIKLVEFDKRP